MAKDFISLTKPRVMSLVLFSAICGMYLAPGTLHPFITLISILSIATGACASASLNMWYERDIDALMARTKNRPIPAGKVYPSEALGFGVMLAFISVFVMALAVNWIAAGLLAFSIMFYVFIYTIWLKRRTPQNIVIGGVAGALPPVIGWSSVTGDVTLMPLLLFLVIFLWTPPHFWALSLYYSRDYERAGIPMLPVVSGVRYTKYQILLYSVLVVLSTLSIYVFGFASLFYLITMLCIGALFLFFSYSVWRSENESTYRQLFRYSIAYLFLFFIILIMDKVFQ
jgi:protoheme IX farnesyltransferase